MKVVLDACVLYPTVMRCALIAVAKCGGFQPLWSARILEEWARATRKLGPVAEMQARGEIALLRAHWPKATVAECSGLEARLFLPDPNDVHVLATAISSSADMIVTMNAKDFPRGILAEEGVLRHDPDGFLVDCANRDYDGVSTALASVATTASQMDGCDRELSTLLKKARLPRLAKMMR